MPEGRRIFARMCGGGESGDGRLYPSGWGDRSLAEDVYQRFPRLSERLQADCGHPVRRRTADARDGAGTDGKALAADAG